MCALFLIILVYWLCGPETAIWLSVSWAIAYFASFIADHLEVEIRWR